MIYLRDPSFETDEVDEKKRAASGSGWSVSVCLGPYASTCHSSCDNQLAHACGEGRRAAITDLKKKSGTGGRRPTGKSSFFFLEVREELESRHGHHARRSKMT